jgi:hypothetical protein
MIMGHPFGGVDGIRISSAMPTRIGGRQRGTSRFLRYAAE